MDELAIRGLKWTFLAVACIRAFSLLSVIVLARLLVPEDFGLLAFATLIGSLLRLVLTAGLSASIVIAAEVTSSQLRGAFAGMIALSVLTALVLAAIAPVAGPLIGGSDASAVVAAMGVPLVFRGISSFHSAVLQRELRFARRAAIQIVEAVVTGVVAILLAVGGFEVWSLVIGQIAGAAAGAVTSMSLASPKRPSLDVTAARSMMRQGRGFVWQGTASFIEQNADYFFVGTNLGSTNLGYYSMAYRLSEVPYDAVINPVAQVTFPGFARMKAQGTDVTASFLLVLRLCALATVPAGLLLSGAADPFVSAIFGPTWDNMIPVVTILGVWGSIRATQATIGWFVNSMGFAASIGKSYAVMLVPSIPAVVYASTVSIEAVAVVMTLNILVMTAIVGSIASRRLKIHARAQWVAVRPALTIGGAVWVSSFFVASLTSAMAPGVSLLLVTCAGLAGGALVLSVFDREVLRQVGAYKRLLERAILARGRPAPEAMRGDGFPESLT